MLLDISISKASKKPVSPAMKKGEWKVIRRFDDGLVEIEDHRGRRYRGDVWVCERCFVRTFRKPSIILQPKICNSCADALRVERSKEMDRRAQERRVLMFEQGNTSPQRRNAIFLLACVRWRDRKAIKDVYAEAKRKTAETGIPHDVDHIYPLQGLLGCGLHVHWNLTVMPASENRSK